jgi:hypothetical protein
MPCQWNTDVPCPFSDLDGLGKTFVDYEGRSYCALHLPIDSDRKLGAADFGATFRALQEAGYRDFSGVAFPGAAGPNENPRIDIVREVNLKSSTFGNRLDIVVNNVPCDLSGSTCVGSSALNIASGHVFVCDHAVFASDVTIHAGNQPSDMDFTSSRFSAGCRFTAVDQVRRINLSHCVFRSAPVFANNAGIPQKTIFRGAKFELRAEDESAYRVIRNFFHAHRARDAEGRFYALEKRCQRRGMTRPQEWVPRALSFLYDVSSEYGYSYGWALLWFCLVQVVFTLLYAALSGKLELGGGYDSRVVAFSFGQIVKPFELFSSRVFTDGAYGIIPAGNRGWWLSLTAVQSVLSIALGALFLLAIRWRFRRE